MPNPTQPAAITMLFHDETGAPIGGRVPIDPKVLSWDAGIEHQYRDGMYVAIGHLGDFVFGLQRVRRTPVEAPSSDASESEVSAMDMRRAFPPPPAAVVDGEPVDPGVIR